MIEIYNRKKTEETAKQLWEICQEAYQNGSPWNIQQIKNDLLNQTARYLLYSVEGRIVGFVGVTGIPPEWEITNVAVRGEYQAQGIASSLLAELARSAVEYGVEEIFLEVRITNQSAIRLYQKFGFDRIGVRKNYYHDPTEDAMIMKFEV